MYCPICFNNSLQIARSGVALVLIDNVKMDSTRIIYHSGEAERPKLISDIEEKVENYFKWYATLQNKKAIKKIEIVTSEVKCENNCRLKAETKFSIVNVIISNSDIIDLVEKLAKKYHLSLNINNQYE